MHPNRPPLTTGLQQVGASRKRAGDGSRVLVCNGEPPEHPSSFVMIGFCSLCLLFFLE
jgi:hypothetical protein